MASELPREAEILAGKAIETMHRAGGLVAIGLPVLVYFAGTAAVDHDWPLFALLASTIAAVIGTFLLGKNASRGSPKLYPMLVCISLLMLYVVHHSAVEHSRALWFFILPIIVLTALRPIGGAIWTFVCIAFAAGIMIVTPQGPETMSYAPAFIIRFAITASVITGALVWTDLLVARYRETALQQHEALAQEAKRLEDEIAQRTALELELRVLATTDSLTDLLNRRAFIAALGSEVQRSQRLGRPLALLVLDIDHFKQINDSFGHPAGDAALAHLSVVMRHTLRGIDLIGRIGGEEFAAILVDADVATTPPIGERLLNAVRSSPVVLASGQSVSMTVSIGSAQAKPDDTVETLMKRADDAMYAAKSGGRDRYCAVS